MDFICTSSVRWILRKHEKLNLKKAIEFWLRDLMGQAIFYMSEKVMGYHSLNIT